MKCLNSTLTEIGKRVGMNNVKNGQDCEDIFQTTGHKEREINGVSHGIILGDQEK
jgi:hypothetical protein